MQGIISNGIDELPDYHGWQSVLRGAPAALRFERTGEILVVMIDCREIDLLEKWYKMTE